MKNRIVRRAYKFQTVQLPIFTKVSSELWNQYFAEILSQKQWHSTVNTIRNSCYWDSHDQEFE